MYETSAMDQDFTSSHCLALILSTIKKILQSLCNVENTKYYLSLFLIITVLLFYFYVKYQCNYFKRRGVKNVPFKFPLFGNLFRISTRQEHFKDNISRLYNAFPDQKYIGFMQFNQPLYMIRDLEVLKQVTIKDFDHFMNHKMNIDDVSDPLLGGNLFLLRGEKWRDMRTILTPAFTISKMKNMFELVEQIAVLMINYFNKQMDEPINKERGLVETEMKDIFTRYTNDVLTTSAFGLKVNSLTERDNDIYKMGKLSSDFSGFQMLKLTASIMFPKLYKYAGIEYFGRNIKKFFTSLINDTIKNREENHIIRHDMMHLLMQAKKGLPDYDTNQKNHADFTTIEESEVGNQTVKRKWTNNDIVAQAILLFIAGLDTSSTLMCFMAHEITINPEVQKKLQEEIDELVSRKGKCLDYNDLAKMKYMDMVVSETLRLWPPAIASDRECIKPFQLPPVDDTSDKPGYTIQTDEGIWIPIWGFHHDPKYFPNPEEFDPERFSDENKDKIHPLSYLPFGIGPRYCIGSLFVLMIAKAIIFHLLANFDFVETAKTQNPLKMKNDTFHLHPEKGFWIGLKPRNINYSKS